MVCLLFLLIFFLGEDKFVFVELDFFDNFVLSFCIKFFLLGFKIVGVDNVFFIGGFLKFLFLFLNVGGGGGV